MLIRWISCHHPTRQLLHTCLEIKRWAWAPVAAEKRDASPAGESILPELLLFSFASQEKGRGLAVVSLRTPGSQERHFKLLSRYIFLEGNWGMIILFAFHWEFGRAGNWSLLSKALCPWTTLTYHKDPVSLVLVLFSNYINLYPAAKSLWFSTPRFSTCSEIPLTPRHGPWIPTFHKAQWDKK